MSEPMTWTTAPPTGPGWYWIRGVAKPPEVVRIGMMPVDHRTTLALLRAGSGSPRRLVFADLADFGPGVEWAGPLAPPPDQDPAQDATTPPTP